MDEKNDFEGRENWIRQVVEGELPQFKKLCELAAAGDMKVIQHQDAFAADYQPEEFMLLGMAIKYAGMHGIEMVIHGKNRETLHA